MIAFFLLISTAFLQAGFLPYQIVYAGILALSFAGKSGDHLWKIFLLGILVDLLNLTILGLNSLVYILTFFLLSFFQGWFKSKNIFFLCLPSAFFLFLYDFFFAQSFSFLGLVLEQIVFIFLFLLFNIFEKKSGLVYENKP